MGLFSDPKKRGRKLLEAITSGNTEKATALIKKQTDIKIRDKDGYTALQLALRKGYPEIALQLINAGADVNEKMYGNTTLHLASEKNYPEIARLSLEKGVPINEGDSFKKTALILASGNGHIDIVKLLIEKGADINEIAIWDIVEYYEERDYEPPPDLDIPGTYNEYVGFSGWDRTETKSRVIGKKYATALTEAVKKQHTDIARLLLENGAAGNIQTDDDRTALHFAAANDDLEMVQLLIEKGAKINVKDKKGRTPLHLATQTGNSALVKLLIDHGADF